MRHLACVFQVVNGAVFVQKKFWLGFGLVLGLQLVVTAVF